MLAIKNEGRKRKVQPIKNQVKLYRSIDDKSHLLHLPQGYSISPPAAEIFGRRFIVNDLVIKFMSTTAVWKGQINLKRLRAPLSALIDLGRTHIEVYPKQQQKPMAGTQLNRTCFVTFSNLRKISQKKLKLICESNKCQLIRLNRYSNQFTVQIPHFSRYKFCAEADDSDQEELFQEPAQQHMSQQNGMRTEDSLPAQLRQRHASRIMQQNTRNRTSLETVSFPITQARSYLPTQQCLSAVQQHNQQKGHIIEENRIRGSSSTIGINVIVHTYIQSTNLHFILFKNPQSERTQLIKMVIDMMSDGRKINEYILNPQIEFRVKRVLSLYIICFNFNQCLFRLEKRGGSIVIVGIQQPPEQHYQVQYLKNWFQWVIQQDQQAKLISDEMIKSLVHRRVQQQAERCSRFQQYQDFQFLSSIEDETYRCGDPPKNLGPVLRAICYGDMSNFRNYSWLIRFGVYLWYYSFHENAGEELKTIISSTSSQQSGYYLEHQILSTYFELKFSDQKLSFVDNKEYPLWWFFSNKVNQKEKGKQNNEQENQKYLHYRFNLLMELTQMYADINITLQLISHESFLQREKKLNIIKIFAEKYTRESENCPVPHGNIYYDYFYYSEACIHYANTDYIKALQYFSKCNKIQKYAVSVIRRIVQKEEIISGFHYKTIEKTKQILEEIAPKIELNSLKYYICLLNTQLGRQKITAQKMGDMIYLCKNIKNERLRKRLYEIIFREGMKSPLVISALKNKLEISVPSANKKINQLLQSEYKDPSYLLEIKLANLQL